MRRAPHAGRLSRRDRDEPQVRDGDSRGARSARRAPQDPRRPCPRPAPAQGWRARRPPMSETSETGPAPNEIGHEAAGSVSAIVLAGGRSSRFGSDKLAARYGDSTLLALAVSGVAAVSTEVIVVVAPGDDRQLPAASVPVQRAIDPEP